MIAISLYSKIKYLISSMKGKRTVERPPSHKLLSGEAQKLKDKLQLLREQIKIKKQQKEMNKTTQSISSLSSAKTNDPKQKMNNTSYTQKEDKQLYSLLVQMKMETIEPKLKERNIFRIDQLINTSQEQIDKWKDIPVGYRIKLKKYIEKNKQKSFSPLNGVVYQDENTLTTETKDKNIEDIIKNRNIDKMFIPIHRHSEEHLLQQPQLQQQEQQKMMLSILDVIHAKRRVSSLKVKDKSAKGKKAVHWSTQVDEMQKNHKQVKIYPKQTISKSAFHTPLESIKQQVSISAYCQSQYSKEQSNNMKYCWSCLKRIKNSALQQSQRQYCSKDCERKYLQTVNPIDLFKQLEQTEEEYNRLMEDKVSVQKEEIDFNIS